MTDDEVREFLRSPAGRVVVVEVLRQEARMRSHWWINFVRREIRIGSISLRDAL